MTTAFDDPLAPAGAQFPLGRPDTAPPYWDEPSPPGVRNVGVAADLDLDVRIVVAGPVAAALLGSTDNGCNTRKDGDC
ncbi:MAG: hypothetical protein ACRDRP_14620 [Pseudonocardiaceae bacterium]